MRYEVKNIYGKTTEDRVEVSVPGSKSLTARALLMAALAKGESTLSGCGLSDDCLTFIKCLCDLGVEVKLDGDVAKVTGCGGTFPKSEAKIDVGGAGTAARFLVAALGLQDGRYEVVCSDQMKRRPMEDLFASLESLGAKVTYEGEAGSFPVTIEGRDSFSDEIEVDIEKSSQYLSGLLLAAGAKDRRTKIKFSGDHGLRYVDMTANLMRSFGADVERGSGSFIVGGGYEGADLDIEPDVSAASYFYAANKILGTNIEVRGMKEDSLQGDMRFIEMLPSFDGGLVDMADFSDQALTLAAIAPYLGSPTEITGIGHIRGQECDRIEAIRQNLTAMGIRCEAREASVKIWPGDPKSCEVETFGDHRVAMSFAVTGLRSDGIAIKDCEVCSKTFKEYFDVLDETIEKLARG